MKRTIKALSIVLALLLLFSALPLAASAEETDAAETGNPGGTFGDCTWSLDPSTKTLTIDGNGYMPEDNMTSPWNEFRYSVHSVVIGDEVKSVAPSCFKDHTNLSSVTFGESVESIGYAAFKNTSISYVWLPDSVRVIDKSAFADNLNLNYVRLSEDLEVIYPNAFLNDPFLTYVAVPSPDVVFDRTEVEYDAIFGYTLDEDLRYVPIQGFTMLGYPNSTAQAWIEGHSRQVENYGWKFEPIAGTIGDCEWLYDDGYRYLTVSGSGYMPTGRSVTIPWEHLLDRISQALVEDGVKNICCDAFANCQNLRNISIGDTVERIGSGAFYNTGLSYIYFPDSVRYFDSGSVSSLPSLEEVRIGSNVVSFGDQAFYNDRKLKDIAITSDSASIGFCAFGCYGSEKKVEDFTIYGYTGSTIHNYATEMRFDFVPLDGTDGGDGIRWRFDRNNERLIFTATKPNASINDFRYQQARPWSQFAEDIYYLEIGDGITEIGDFAFSDMTKLLQVNMSADVAYIGSGAFYNTNLYSIIVKNPSCQLGLYSYGYIDEPHEEGQAYSLFYPDPDDPVIFGYKNSTAQRYAENNPHISFIDINRHAEFDKDTGVFVFTTEMGAELRVEEVDAGRYVVVTGGQVLTAYDISLVRDGEEIQPEDEITVRVPISEDNTDAHIYRVEEDGTLTDMNAYYFDGDLVFHTDHLSLYLVGYDVTIEPEPPARAPVITKQPQNWTGLDGEQVSISVTAEGAGLTYKWYYFNLGTKRWVSANDFDSCYDMITMASKYNGREVYCKITDKYGNTVSSDSATISYPAIIITEQPQNWTGVDGEQVSIPVTAVGKGLSYRWYYFKPETQKWVSANDTDDCYDTITMAAKYNGREVRCRISDTQGNSVMSDVATISYPPVYITEQPENWCGYDGEQVSISVSAQGEGLTYKWYYYKPDTQKWIASNDTDFCYDSITMAEKFDGRQVHCVVTDNDGNSVTSDAATISYKPVTIAEQPEDWVGVDGEQIYISVYAEGHGLTYKWYYWKPETKKWVSAGDTDSCYDSITMAAKYNGRQVYCKVTDAAGNTVSSETATISYPSVRIITQPASWSGRAGEQVNIPIVAEGDIASYQWYYWRGDRQRWIKADTDSCYDSITMAAKYDGREVKCVVTGTDGTVVESDIATLSYIAGPTIITQPADWYGDEGETTAVTVIAEGEGLTYQWYYWKESKYKWIASTDTDNVYDVVMTASLSSRKIKCRITDAAGVSVDSNVATLYIPKG